jgi:hypothetical protein
VIFAIVAIIQILTTRDSSIGSLYRYVTIGFFVFAVFRTRTAIYLIVPLSCSLDLLKRLMIFGGVPTEIELAFVQAIPMLMVCGAAVGCFLPFFMGHVLSKKSVLSLVISGILVILLLLSGGSTGGILRQAGQAANMGVYSLLLFVMPLVIKTSEDRIKFLKFTFICFIPVALYMIKHYYYGLADFEYQYLMTGLSQEIRIFTDDGDARRYFSTLNSAATVSTMLSVLALFGFVRISNSKSSNSFVSRSFKILISLLFLYAASLTLSRTGWVCGLTALVAFFFFGNRLRLITGYALGMSVIILLLFTADYIIKYRILDEWQNYLIENLLRSNKSANAERAVVLGTMYDRLSGWRYLVTQPEGFPALGEMFGGKVTVKMVDSYRLGHDIIISYLIKLGWIPMSLLFILGTYLLRKLHAFQFSLDKKSEEFRMTRYCLASFLGILAGGMANGAQLFNFPQNFYFWVWLSMALAIYQRNAERNKLHRSQIETDFARLPESLIRA